MTKNVNEHEVVFNPQVARIAFRLGQAMVVFERKAEELWVKTVQWDDEFMLAQGEVWNPNEQLRRAYEKELSADKDYVALRESGLRADSLRTKIDQLLGLSVNHSQLEDYLARFRCEWITTFQDRCNLDHAESEFRLNWEETLLAELYPLNEQRRKEVGLSEGHPVGDYQVFVKLGVLHEQADAPTRQYWPREASDSHLYDHIRGDLKTAKDMLAKLPGGWPRCSKLMEAHVFAINGPSDFSVGHFSVNEYAKERIHERHRPLSACARLGRTVVRRTRAVERGSSAG